MLNLLTKMINKEKIKSYCKDDISMIENYDKAVSDTTQMWHCHHRRETIFSKSDLIEIGEYYNRPACELIFLTSLEHHRLHNLGKPSGMKDKHHSEEYRKKMSESNKGEKNPFFGKNHSAEARKKMSEAKKGKHLSEEHKRKLGDVKKGTHWFNNSVISVLARECPEGFVKGRIKK